MTNNETLTIRLSKEDKDIIEHYAQSHGVTMAQLVKESTLEKIEEDIDLLTYKKAMKEYMSDSTTYSLEDAERILGI